MLRRLALLGLVCVGLWAQKTPFDVHAMLKLKRISEPRISPDGKTIAFTVTTIDVAQNTKPRQIWVVPVDGGEPRAITREGNNERPRWAPDSKRIAFISSRGGTPQVWLMDADGANAKQVTTLANGASGVLFAGDGKNLVFSSEVYPDCADEACNKAKLEAEKNSKVKARIYTGLLYRHWNEWQGARRRHLFVVPVEGGTPKDLTPGKFDVPPFSLGGGDDYAVSPDGQELCYVMNADAEPAMSTNSDLYVVPIGGGEATKITANPGADNGPVYSPDGKHIAYRAQFRAGYEADRWRLLVMERAGGRNNTLTEGLDRSVGSITWSPDSSRIFFTTEDRGRTAVQMMSAGGGGARVIISGASTVDDVEFTPDGKTMVYSEQTGARPVELYRVSSGGGAAVPLTHLNTAELDRLGLPAFEEFWVEGAERTRVHSLLLKPHGFQEGKKYPALFLIHGGPQSAWRESFSFRWNPQVFAAAGFVVVMPNPRGSTGYGQRFTDEINADWGGKVYDDIMAVVDHVAGLEYVDGDRLAAAGGSYGGYMVNWILGHSNRFRALVSHAGVFDLRSMAGETEELWFPAWEFRGMPWDNPDVYHRWSPSFFVKDFKTPTLVIHGELDYRVPVGQGLQLFTGLQMQKVPSKLLLFPDEGHWIQKPQNTVLWYQSFVDWIGEWTRKAAK
jgi:dipeptidyl aminopeptidase/acylaminoacyl peptidase